MTEQSSCLVKQFQRIIDLTEREREMLTDLEKGPRCFEPASRLVDQGQTLSNLYIVQDGWAYSSYALPDDRRQIVDVYLPGDVIGTREVLFERSVCTVEALDELHVCAWARRDLPQFFSGSPRLGHVLYSLAMRNEAMMIERVINLGRRDALERICHFVMELRIRLDRIGSPGKDLYFPFSIRDLADVLGLSSMHIRRCIKKLRQREVLDIRNRRAHILDEGALVDCAHFSDAYLNADHRWIGPDQ